MKEKAEGLQFDLGDDGVLFLKPNGPLSRNDFDRVSAAIDPWLESHKELAGVVVAIHKFPGWENLGSAIRHFEFVRDHHKKVHRVALAVDGIMPDIASHVAAHFVAAQVKQFSSDHVDDAIRWAKGA